MTKKDFDEKYPDNDIPTFANRLSYSIARLSLK